MRYLETKNGCCLPYINNTVIQKNCDPACNASGVQILMKEYVHLIDGGERDIYLRSGCLSRFLFQYNWQKNIHYLTIIYFFSCRRKEYTIEKVEVDTITMKQGFSPAGISPPSQPDLIPGTTTIIIFYAGTM